MKSLIRVGNAQAFWGDRPSAAAELLMQSPDLDFLTMDYLAEVSMSILALQRERDPSLGYPQDFVSVVRSLAPYWNSGGKCRLIANAGGLNPLACAAACKDVLERSGCQSMKIGVVHGDNVLSILQASNGDEPTLRNLDSNSNLIEVRERLVTANAYLGCQGIVEALKAGADIVITGRVADPSMVLAPAVYTFGWQTDDWDRLAGGTVAGHLLECGTHVTGGIATDWLSVPDPTHIGFPIAEISPDGSCVITKSDSSGGCVTEVTVKEQLIYEIGNPDRYQSPDVTVSFLSLNVESHGLNRVRVHGAKGSAPPETLKVSATYRDGYRAAGMLTFFGPQSVRKARLCGDMVLQRLHEAGCTYRDTLIECLGNAESVPVRTLANHADSLHETVLRIAVESDSKQSVEQFTRELMPLVTAGPQGTTGYAEGRPRVHGVYRYWPCLIETEKARHQVAYMDVNAQRPEGTSLASGCLAPWPTKPSIEQNVAPFIEHSRGVSDRSQAHVLSDLAYGRSGDKGTGANIGILIRRMENYPWLVSWLTSERVAAYFDGMGITAIERYEVPNLGGVNFVVRGILRRGLRNDAQGKALAQALLSMAIEP